MSGSGRVSASMLERGHLTLFRARGVPVRAHWSLPILVIVLAALGFTPGFWIGLLVLLVVHEAGHAYVVHRVRLVNLGIDLSAFGGRCRYAGDPTDIDRSLVAFGGVLSQLVVLVPAAIVVALFGWPSSPSLAGLLEALTGANLALVVINLLPIPSLDGYVAWPLFKHLWRARARKQKWKRKLTTRQTLREALEEADRRD